MQAAYPLPLPLPLLTSQFGLRATSPAETTD